MTTHYYHVYAFVYTFWFWFFYFTLPLPFFGSGLVHGSARGSHACCTVAVGWTLPCLHTITFTCYTGLVYRYRFLPALPRCCTLYSTCTVVPHAVPHDATSSRTTWFYTVTPSVLRGILPTHLLHTCSSAACLFTTTCVTDQFWFYLRSPVYFVHNPLCAGCYLRTYLAFLPYAGHTLHTCYRHHHATLPPRALSCHAPHGYTHTCHCCTVLVTPSCIYLRAPLPAICTAITTAFRVLAFYLFALLCHRHACSRTCTPFHTCHRLPAAAPHLHFSHAFNFMVRSVAVLYTPRSPRWLFTGCGCTPPPAFAAPPAPCARMFLPPLLLPAAAISLPFGSAHTYCHCRRAFTTWLYHTVLPTGFTDLPYRRIAHHGFPTAFSPPPPLLHRCVRRISRDTAPLRIPVLPPYLPATRCLQCWRFTARTACHGSGLFHHATARSSLRYITHTRFYVYCAALPLGSAATACLTVCRFSAAPHCLFLSYAPRCCCVLHLHCLVCLLLLLQHGHLPLRRTYTPCATRVPRIFAQVLCRTVGCCLVLQRTFRSVTAIPCALPHPPFANLLQYALRHLLPGLPGPYALPAAPHSSACALRFWFAARHLRTEPACLYRYAFTLPTTRLPRLHAISTHTQYGSRLCWVTAMVPRIGCCCLPCLFYSTPHHII